MCIRDSIYCTSILQTEQSIAFAHENGLTLVVVYEMPSYVVLLSVSTA